MQKFSTIQQCAGLGCAKPGNIVLRLRYLNLIGHFCDKCAADLLMNDLAFRPSEVAATT